MQPSRFIDINRTDRRAPLNQSLVKEVSVEEQARGTVVALTNDLFFSVKLANQIRLAGFAPKIVKSVDAFRDALAAPDVALGVVDLSARPELNDLRTDWTANVPIIAFGPHKDVAAFRDAKAAGMTRVMSNSQFHAQTVQMMQRYARAGAAE